MSQKKVDWSEHDARFERADKMNAVELCETILANKDQLVSGYKTKNINIAKKGLKFGELSNNERYCLATAYSYMINPKAAKTQKAPGLSLLFSIFGKK